MKDNILNFIDFEKVNSLLEGFNNATGFVTAILDLDGNILSKSGWRQICTEFHRVHPETAKKCSISDTELATKLGAGEKYHSYKCLNGLVDVAVPIIVNDEHVANLFSGQFFFEKPNKDLFIKQAQKYKFDNKKYLEALDKVPIVSEEKVKIIMDFLLSMTNMISELTKQRIKEIESRKILKESEERWQFAIEGNGDGLWDWNIQTNEVFYSKQYKALLGFEDDEIENKLEEWEKRVHPDDKAAAYLDIQNHLEGKTEIYNNEHRLMCKNGSYKWIEDRGKIISRTENNKPLRFIGTLRDITEQKQAEYLIQESEEKYKALFNNAPLSYQSLDEQGRFIDVNPSWLRTLGYERDEVIGKFYADFLHPDWKPHFEKNFPEFKKRGYVNDVQFKIKHKKGHFIDISFEGCIGYLPDGSFKQTYCVFQDITEKKKAEKLLLESEEKYKQLYESNQMPISIFDTETLKFLSVNSAFVEKYGYTEEEFLKMTILDIRPDTETPKVKQSVSKIDNGLTNAGVFLHKKKNGEIIHVEIIRYDLVFEGKNAKLVFANDITDRIQAEEKLMESEEKFRSFVNTASDLMCITNKDGQLTDVNSAMADVLDYSTDELKEMHISNLLTKEALKNDFNPNWEKFIKDGEIKIETTFKTKGGNEIPGELKAIAIYNNSGKLIGTRAVFIDLTKYKHAEDELRKQKEIFELVINSVPIRIFWKDLNSVYLGCNQAFAEASGPQKIEAVIGKNDYDLIWAEEAEKYIKDDRQVINSGIPKIAYDENYITPDGEKVWWRSNKMPLKYSNGNIFGILATSEDVTERKQAEIEMFESKAKLEAAISSMSDALFISDVKGQLIHMNKSFALFHKFKDIQECSKIFEEYPMILDVLNLDGEVEPIENWAIPRALSGETATNIEFKLRRRDTLETWIGSYNFAPILDNKGVIIGSVVTARDITERKLAEEELTKHREHLEELIKARTAELEEKNKELESFNKVFVGREIKMVELKEKIKELENKLK